MTDVKLTPAQRRGLIPVSKGAAFKWIDGTTPTYDSGDATRSDVLERLLDKGLIALAPSGPACYTHTLVLTDLGREVIANG